MCRWRSYWESNLTPHYVAARAFLPVLARRKESSYTLLGGLSAVLPIPNYSIIAVNSAAQLMMARVLMEEMKDAAVRINTRARAAYARPEWITVDEVVFGGEDQDGQRRRGTVIDRSQVHLHGYRPQSAVWRARVTGRFDRRSAVHRGLPALDYPQAGNPRRFAPGARLD